MIFFDSDEVGGVKERGQAGAVSVMAVAKTTGPIARSEMHWQPHHGTNSGNYRNLVPMWGG